ncbi:4111_t:CDS:10 [Ambispora gerdemannii]|uniref:4111_t:CDS:1 n=1 Tax=Ambispora gerdemannii TaxID=144530 RepID=A0A9N8YWE7_9GLOM|nr:4111_t:CDS:10 [Ambispora gerdemannii]
MQLFVVNEALIAYTVLGGFIVIFGLVSLIVREKLYLSEACPACLNLIDPTRWEYQEAITEELTRIVLAIQVMAAAVNLPRTYVTRHATSMFIMLVPVMTFMWVVSALIIYIVIPDAGFTETLLIASCITPTDPAPNNPISAFNKWVCYTWGYHIMLSVFLGFVIGWLARKLLRMAESNDWIDKESFLSFSFALAIFVVGFVSLLGSDAFLACFVAGTSFTWDDWFREETRDAHLQGVIDLLLNLTTFIYIGTIFPWSSFYDDALSLRKLIPISILILIFRRLPIVVGLKKFIPAIHTFKEALFAGYFGPIGVGAIFLAVTVEREIDKTLWEYPELPEIIDKNGLMRTKERVFPIVAFIVLSSVIVHGITVPILNIGSRIDIERFPSIASISNQVARLPVIDFVENLTLERDAQGSEVEGSDHVVTGVLVEFDDFVSEGCSKGDTQSSSSSSPDSVVSEGGSNYASRPNYHHVTLNNLD